MDDQLIQACQGVSYSKGGLNIPDMKQRLLQMFPHHEIKSTKTRSELNKLCTLMLNSIGDSPSSPIRSSSPTRPFSPTCPSSSILPSSPTRSSSRMRPSSPTRSSSHQRFSSPLHVVHQMYPVFHPLPKFEGDVSYLQKPQTFNMVIPININDYDDAPLVNYHLSQEDLESIDKAINKQSNLIMIHLKHGKKV